MSKPDALDEIIRKNLKLTTDQLGLGRKELLPFWKEFNKIDVDKSGRIQLDEIFMTKKIPETEWGRAVRVLPPPPTFITPTTHLVVLFLLPGDQGD